MKVDVKVPAMGESITEATVGEILKPSGSHVVMDEEILELETDKVNQVLSAPQTGILTLSVNKDETVKIGQIIGNIDGDGAVQHTDKEKPLETVEQSAKAINTESKQRPLAKDKNARLTKEAFIDQLKPVVGPEVEKIPSQEAKPPKLPPKEQVEAKDRETRRPMTKIRRLIAQRLIEVKQNTAMLTTFNEVDMTVVMELRAKYKDHFKKEYDTKLGLMSFFVKAAVSALMTFPNVNSYISGDDIVHCEYYDIGIAVGAEKGLVVPVVRDCDLLSFAEVEKAIENYATKVHEGTISADDLHGGCFTITNGGTYGSLLSTPILNPPQSAILGMHKIEKRAVVINDAVVIRPMMYLALSYDHRLIDGKEAVSFLVHIKNCLEDPSRLLLEASHGS